MRAEGASEGQSRAFASYLVLLLLLALFFVTFFNRFAGLRSGNGEFTGGVALLDGRLPYRDYFTAAPPLNVLKSAALLKLFGPAVIVSRIGGVLERLLLGALLFHWLKRIVTARNALIAALVAIVLSAGDRTDPLASYNHDAILWAVIAGVLASSFLRVKTSRGAAILASLSGVAAGLSLLTKQTIGLLVVICLLIVPPMLVWSNARARSKLWAIAFPVGCGVPVLGAGCVLAHFGVLRPALSMLFVAGPAAKAGQPGDFLIRYLLVAWDNLCWVVLGAFWFALAWRPLRRTLSTAGTTDALEIAKASSAGSLWLAKLFATGLGLLGAAELLVHLPALHDATKAVVYATCGALPLVLFCLWHRSRSRTITPAEQEVLLLASLSSAVSVALALSWPAFEAMLLPGAALVIALLLSGVSGRARAAAYTVLALLVLLQVREKLNLPFGFDLQDEASVSAATRSSELPLLAGLRLPPAMVDLLDNTAQLAREHTRPGDSVFTYPEIGLVYAVTGRTPPTFAGSHNIDVLNDRFAHEECARIRANPPAILVYYAESESDLRGAERLWRRGKASGQREIIATLENLLPHYRLVALYTLRPGDPPIRVYLREDRQAQQ